MWLPRLIAGTLVGLLAAGCATQQQMRQEGRAQDAAARGGLTAALEECGRVHGYNPREVSGVGEHALAPNELAWRQCAYEAVREHRARDPEVRKELDLLVAQDIAMTAAIREGTMTRSQRKRLNSEKFQEIRQLQLARERAAVERREQVVEGLRSFPLF